MSNKTDRELLQSALNYLMLPGAYAYIDGVKALREEIRVRLAEPEDEPFAWFSPKLTETYMATWYKPHDGDLPLYRHPRQPVRLSDEEICEIAEASRAVEGKAMLPVAFARAIEKAIWEKNK